MKRMMFVINPAAGRSIIRDNLMGVVKTFADDGYVVSLYITQKKGDGTVFVAKEAHNYDMVVCAGGDGTLNEVVNGLLQNGAEVPLGYIPAGTTNDFAVSHNLSRFPRQAARHIVQGVPRAHDIGVFNERYFTYVAACGLFTDVSFSTPQGLKNAFGRFAYYFEGAKKIPELTQEFALTLDIDGEIYFDNFCFLAVANSLSLGGVLQFPERVVSMSDGILEVLAIRAPQNPLDLQRLMRSMKDKDYNNDTIRCLHGRHIKVQSDKPIVWTVDGESGGSVLEADIQVHDRQIQLIY